MRFSPYDMHVEALAAAAWPDAEKIGVVCHLDLALFPGDVDTYRQALSVGVKRSQRCVLGCLHVFLEEEAQGGIGEREEKVIVRVEGIGIAGETVREKLQLVVGGTGGHDAALVQLGFQKGCHGSHLVRRTAYQNVEVAVYQEGAVNGKAVQDLLDVRQGYLVARVGHGTVPFGLALQLAEQFPLLGYLHDLIVHHAVGMGHLGQEGQQVGGDAVAVDVHLRVRLDQCGQAYLVYIHQRIGTDDAVSGLQVFVRCLEVGHRERTVPETEHHEAVAVFVDLFLGEPAVADVFLPEDVVHLVYFYMEVQPFLGVVLHELAALCLLCDDEVGAYLRELPSLKVAEVAFGQELRVFRHVVVVSLLAEDVLLLQGISLAECLYHTRKHVLKVQILFRIRTELLHGVGHLEDDRRLALG